MIVAALLLLVIVALIVLWVVAGADTGQDVKLSAIGIDVTMNALTVYLLGAVSAVLALLAIWMIKSGSARGMRHRRERKAMQQRVAVAEDDRTAAEQAKDRADVAAARDRVAARDAEREQQAELDMHLRQERNQGWSGTPDPYADTAPDGTPSPRPETQAPADGTARPGPVDGNGRPGPVDGNGRPGPADTGDTGNSGRRGFLRRAPEPPDEHR